MTRRSSNDDQWNGELLGTICASSYYEDFFRWFQTTYWMYHSFNWGQIDFRVMRTVELSRFWRVYFESPRSEKSTNAKSNFTRDSQYVWSLYWQRCRPIEQPFTTMRYGIGMCIDDQTLRKSLETVKSRKLPRKVKTFSRKDDSKSKWQIDTKYQQDTIISIFLLLSFSIIPFLLALENLGIKERNGKIKISWKKMVLKSSLDIVMFCDSISCILFCPPLIMCIPSRIKQQKFGSRLLNTMPKQRKQNQQHW